MKKNIAGRTRIIILLLVIGVTLSACTQPTAKTENITTADNGTKQTENTYAVSESVIQSDATTSASETDAETDFYDSNLIGLSVNAIGDSYFEGNGLKSEYVWLNLMAKKYAIDMNNYGKNGSTVSNYVTEYNPMCERYANMTENYTDIILIEGGKNDFNKNVPIGTEDSRDTKTFSGALNVIIDGMKEKYPDAMIVCISPWNFTGTNGNGQSYLDYANAMREVAKAQDVFYIRACDPTVSGVNMQDPSFRAQYCMKSTDVSHLNAEGMKIAMAHFEKILSEYYQIFLSA